MIEIAQTRSRRDEKNKIKSRKKSSAITKGEKAFSSRLQDTMVHIFDGAIDELLSDLKDQENKFLQLQSEYELKMYKALIQKILKTILEESFQEKILKRKRKNCNNFTIVEKINSRLIKISEAITRSNKAFNLMKTIEEIRGLILDMLY